MERTKLRHAPAWLNLAAIMIRHLPAARYRTMSWLCRRPVAPFLMKLSEGAGRYSFKCDLRDSIAREVCFTNQYEPQETSLLKAILRPGMSFVDVGANWGYFTLLAAHFVGAGGRVVSLEPDPRLFDVLKENLARNELRQVTALQVAAANERGTLTLAGYDERSENWGLSKLVAQPASEANTFAVTGCSLDTLLDDLGIESIDLLKMDIEGAEALAVEGMSAGLARHRYRRILLEVHPTILAEQGRTTEEVLNLLIAAGYKGWWIDHSQAAIRRAAYSRSLNPAEYLKPLACSSNSDAWPHIFWSVPGLELPE